MTSNHDDAGYSRGGDGPSRPVDYGTIGNIRFSPSHTLHVPTVIPDEVLDALKAPGGKLHVIEGSKGATDEAAIKAQAEAITAGLGREPNAIEKILIEQISALTVQVRRLRAEGDEDLANITTDQLLDALAQLDSEGDVPDEASESDDDLRDHFAGQALPAMIAQVSRNLTASPEEINERAAFHAYAAADAMMAERARRSAR